MKQCRFCNNEIPFYGCDSCDTCLKEADERERRKQRERGLNPMQQTEFIKFRIFQMPCCGIQICWVNPRLPNYCPECGERCFLKLKSNLEHTLFSDSDAKLTHST